jgi:PAS domain S-box-containing protein
VKWFRVFNMDEAEEIVGFGVWTWDIDSGVVQWSDALRRIYGLEPGMFGGTPEAFVAFLHPDDRERVWALISRAVSEVGDFAFERRIVRADGEERTLLSRGHALTNGQHNVRVVGVCQDDTDQRDAASVIGHSERRMRAIIDNTPSIVAVKDLDGTYLMANRETAVVLGAHPDDVIGRKCAELFPADIAERLLAADRRAAAEGTAVYDEAVLYRNGEPRDYLTVTFPLPEGEGRAVETCTIGTDVTEIRRLESRRRERIEWGGRLTAAVNENRLLAYAQPVVDVITGHAFANEMLVRLRTTDGTLLQPVGFLVAAERLGLVQVIDVWMVERALQRGLPCTVNISSVTLCDSGARKEIADLLGASPAQAEQIVFEITETAAVEHLDAAVAFAKAVQALGCALALDDFGTGFGSFTYLRMLPLSYLKIDISFVRDLIHSKDDERVVQSIVGTAQRFNLRTIAEGVEDEPTLVLLRQLGVDYAQGFYVGRPAPLEP